MDKRVKTILIAVATAVVIGIVIFITLKLSGALDKINANNEEKKLQDMLEGEIKQSPASINEAQASQYAEKLYTAMKGIGTDEKAIYEVFSQMTSKGDVLLVMKAFGMKDNKSLLQWLTAELNAKERSKVNNILTEKQINYSI